MPPSPAATCCPQVSTFAKPATQTVYFGYDDTTNQVANAGADEYWIPPTKAKSIPGNKEKRDGAAWVSVGKNEETEVRIAFAGHSGAACIGNVTFKSDNAAVADVNTSSVSGSNVPFKIKGKSAGECSIEVLCNGNTLGYIHVWCASPASIDIDVASVVTAHSRSASYVLADLESYINNVYRDFRLTVNLKDKGDIAVKDPASSYDSSRTNNIALDALVVPAAAKAKKPMTSPYRLLFYVSSGSHSGVLGRVPGGVGTGRSGYSFFDHDTNGAYNTMAHELGHCLDLSHPLHDTDGDEFPAWQRATLGGSNVIPADEWNLMGYKGPVSQRGANRIEVRYRQWKKVRRS